MAAATGAGRFWGAGCPLYQVPSQTRSRLRIAYAQAVRPPCSHLRTNLGPHRVSPRSQFYMLKMRSPRGRALAALLCLALAQAGAGRLLLAEGPACNATAAAWEYKDRCAALTSYQDGWGNASAGEHTPAFALARVLLLDQLLQVPGRVEFTQRQRRHNSASSRRRQVRPCCCRCRALLRRGHRRPWRCDANSAYAVRHARTCRRGCPSLRRRHHRTCYGCAAGLACCRA